MTGTVKFFNEQKGFGFIVYDGTKEIFVHVSGLISQIKEGDTVQFEIVDGKRGPSAASVVVV